MQEIWLCWHLGEFEPDSTFWTQDGICCQCKLPVDKVGCGVRCLSTLNDKTLKKLIVELIKDELSLYGNHAWIDGVARRILNALNPEAELGAASR